MIHFFDEELIIASRGTSWTHDTTVSPVLTDAAQAEGSTSSISTQRYIFLADFEIDDNETTSASL
ncbi:MAG: hypothetical protein WBF33_06110 [Candidatus Nitrosopolaris sp.]|jgi:hypothetical protein